MKIPLTYKKVVTYLIVLIGLFCFSSTVFGQKTDIKDYANYLTEFENVLLLRPDIINDVFLGMVDLKGGSKAAQRYIRQDVLGCQTDSTINQGCRIDQLRLQRRNLRMKRYFRIPLVFTEVSSKRYNRTKKLMTIKWRPKLFQPPSISVQEFLLYVNAAKDSKFYKVKNKLNRIQLNTILEKKTHLIVDNAVAFNLTDLYRQIPDNKKDFIEFGFDYVTTGRRLNTMDYFIYFRATKVGINHQTFTTIPSERLR